MPLSFSLGGGGGGMKAGLGVLSYRKLRKHCGIGRLGGVAAGREQWFGKIKRQQIVQNKRLRDERIHHWLLQA